MLGIIGAMEVEVAALKNEMSDKKVIEKAGMNFYQGKIFDKGRGGGSMRSRESECRNMHADFGRCISDRGCDQYRRGRFSE